VLADPDNCGVEFLKPHLMASGMVSRWGHDFLVTNRAYLSSYLLNPVTVKRYRKCMLRGAHLSIVSADVKLKRNNHTFLMTHSDGKHHVGVTKMFLKVTLNRSYIFESLG